MEIATPAATIYTTLQHDVAEEEEEEEKCPKTYEQQSVLININPTLSLQSTTSQDDELHLSIYSPTLTPTMPLTPPPTSREPYQMPTFLLYQNDSKIEPQEENSASLIEDFGAASTNLPLTPCPICSRKFNSTTFTKHVSICQKTATKRRKVFDSSRQRREGTDLAAYPIPKGYGLPPQPNVLNTKRRDRSNSPLQASDMKTPLVTRKKSVGNNMQTTISTNDELIRSTVRSSMISKVKGSTTGANNNTMSNSTTDGSNFVRDRMRSSERVNAKRSLATQSDQCPHCDRCFGLKAFDRHVEWCKEKALQAAIKTPLKSEPNAAMERLQARTKYRAPCLKTKRTVTRDKYSGMNSEDNGTSIDGLKNKEELAIISTNNAPTSNKTIRDCPSNNNSSIMSQSMTSSILSERKIQLGEVIRYKEEGIDIETKQNYMRIDGESALNVKKHIPNLMFSNLSVRPNKTQVVSPMDDKLQDILKKNAPRKVRNNKKAVELFVGKPSVWVNPDGTLDSDMPLRGLQPRRNSRENSKIIVTESIKPTKKINVRRMGSDTDLVVKSKLSKSMKLAVKTQDPNDLRACNSASSILNLNTVTSQIELGMCNIPITLDVGTLNKPKRKASPLLLSANAHSIKEPMKALPLDQEIYGQLLNIKTIESTHMIRDIESNMKNIKALPVQNSSKSDKCLTPRPTTFQRSMSYTVISPCATEEIKRNYNNNRMEVGAIGNSSTAATTNSDGDGEIFISIEAEQSDSGKSPISPASLRNMVGNSQTVVEIHEVGAINDTKFSKISDNDDYDDHNNNNKDIGDSFTKKRPNVQFNNAKNLTQIKQHPNKNIIRPSGDANEDSDDINSSSTITTITTTTRPIRRTLNHKNSSESFNRSIESSTPVPRGLVNLTRPATATGNLPIAQPTIIQQSQNVQQQQFYKTKGQKSRSNQCVYKDMISSSSSSETSLPPIDFHNKNFHMPHVINNNNNNNNNYSTQHQQELFTSYGKKISSQNSSNNNNNSTSHSRRGSNSRINQSSMETNNSNHNHESHVMMMMMNQNEPNNNNNNATYINSMTSASNNNLELTGMHSSTTSSNPSMTSSACKRMSKFCHECGSKFIVEQAKFCMDCGVKRIIL